MYIFICVCVQSYHTTYMIYNNKYIKIYIHLETHIYKTLLDLHNLSYTQKDMHAQNIRRCIYFMYHQFCRNNLVTMLASTSKKQNLHLRFKLRRSCVIYIYICRVYMLKTHLLSIYMYIYMYVHIHK